MPLTLYGSILILYAFFAGWRTLDCAALLSAGRVGRDGDAVVFVHTLRGPERASAMRVYAVGLACTGFAFILGGFCLLLAAPQ